MLVHPQTLARLNSDGLRLRHGAEIHTTSVKAVTAAELDTTYDVIVVYRYDQFTREKFKFKFSRAISQSSLVTPREKFKFKFSRAITREKFKFKFSL